MDGAQQDTPTDVSAVGAEQHRPVTGIAAAAKILISLVLVGDVLNAVSAWRTHLVVRDYLAGNATTADLDSADVFTTVVSIPALPMYIAAGVVFLIWLWRARINAELLGGRSAHRRSRGWVIGGWFGPVVNLWFPYQVVSDIWRASAPRRPVPGGLITAWWVLFVAVTLIGQILLRSSLEEITEQGLQETANLSTLSTMLNMAAGVLIVVIITQITAWQTNRSTSPEQVRAGDAHSDQGSIDRRTARMALLTLLLGAFGLVPLLILPGIITAVLVLLRVSRGPRSTTPNTSANASDSVGPQADPVPDATATAGGTAGSKTVAVVMALLGLLFSVTWGGIWTYAVVDAVHAPGPATTLVDCENPSAGSATICTMKPGDCFTWPGEVDRFATVELTTCTQPHDAQTIGAYTADGEPWPGWDAFEAEIDARCGPIAERNLEANAVSPEDSLGVIAADQTALGRRAPHRVLRGRQRRRRLHAVGSGARCGPVHPNTVNAPAQASGGRA
ncbi:DUF4328 domain-containing protein [Saccharopolyspora sp. NPDC050389]|uniref:DUF4328 domain-containing protein n=1 Tax=Saccharopolyspora sp. NPDC050389 TaxID=3155516 RepID=UPI0033FF667D